MRAPLSYLGTGDVPVLTITTSVPDTSTVGKLGEIIVDKTNKNAYILTSADGGIYTWESIEGGGGLDFQESVLAQLAYASSTATEGYRYLASETSGLWTKDYIYEYQSGAWEATAPSNGMMTYNEDTSSILVYTGSAWEGVGAAIPDASETVQGVVELATTTEVVAGSDTTRAVTTAGLTAKLGTQTANGVMLGGGAAGFNLGATSAGTAGQPLISSGAGVDPDWGTLSVAYGGTGATTHTIHGVLIGATAGAVVSLTAGTSGQVLLGSTGADPVFGTVGSTDSTIAWTLGAGTLTAQARAASATVTGVIEIATDAETTTATSTSLCITPANLEVRLGTQTQHGVMLGGGAAGTNLSVAAVGTNGQILCGSTGAAPVMATVGHTAGTLTSTLGAGTLNIDTASTMIRTAAVTISNAQLQALNATPIQLVATPGANKYLDFLGAIIALDYGTATIDDCAADGDLQIRYDASTVVSLTVEANDLVDAVADAASTAKPLATDVTLLADKKLELYNNGAEYTVVGGGDGVLKILINYRILDLS